METTPPRVQPAQTTVTMEFESPEDGRTLVTIAGRGLASNRTRTPGDLRHREGWTNALCCMKAWLDHGMNLRDGFYA